MTVIYRHPLLYEAVMRVLYGRAYSARYRMIADLIPANSTVLDLCCGPATLFDRYLRHKHVCYTGLDLSEVFVRRLHKLGAKGWVENIHDATPLPSADFVIMQASLYHFLPDAKPVVDRMLRAAQRQVIIAEPVRNIVDSKYPLAAAIARRTTDPGDGQSAHRFTAESLDRFFAQYEPLIESSFLIPGGREKVFVMNPSAADGRRDTWNLTTNSATSNGAFETRT